MHNYFSSDWHLNHSNIIKYDKRPFASVEEMDATIMKNICTTLRSGDSLYYLGDLAFARIEKTESYLKTLLATGANLFFIKGNHDNRDVIDLYKKYGVYLGEQKLVKVQGQEIVLNHYSMRVWDKGHHGVWHLYGHSHDGLEKYPWGKSMDASVVTAYRIKGAYTLFSFEDIGTILNKRDIKIIDHHGKKEEV